MIDLVQQLLDFPLLDFSVQLLQRDLLLSVPESFAVDFPLLEDCRALGKFVRGKIQRPLRLCLGLLGI